VHSQITVYLNVCAIEEVWLEEKLKKFLEAWVYNGRRKELKVGMTGILGFLGKVHPVHHRSQI